jgi:pimeloyl-ACP methyl ester carboxylesterase
MSRILQSQFLSHAAGRAALLGLVSFLRWLAPPGITPAATAAGAGYEESAVPAITTDLARLPEIHVPVLLAIGAEDKIWAQDGWALQQKHFTGSSDVTARSLPDTGHFVMLELTVPKFRSLVAGWLGRHEFGGP